MQISYGEMKKGSVELAAAIAAARSARNLLSRREHQLQQEEIEANRARARRRRKDKDELEAAVRGRIRIGLKESERPRIGFRTARKLFHRASTFGAGTMGTSDFRGPDGRHSIHFDFVARGFSSWKGRRWRSGEAERAVRYILRESGLDGGEEAWWSNIASSRPEAVGFFRILEAVERNDRKNANVYISEIIALPAELSARQRRFAVRRICRFFEKRGLPFVVALHKPDPAGDQRNWHCHILYSLRPACRLGDYDWEFAVAKVNDINTPEGIKDRRRQVVRDINATLIAARIDKRLTPFSNRVRGMAEPEPAQTQAERAISRRVEALEKRQEMLQKIKAFASRANDALVSANTRLGSAREKIVNRLIHQRLVLKEQSNRSSAVANAFTNVQHNTVSTLRRLYDVVDVACVVSAVRTEISGSVAVKTLRAYARTIVHRRILTANKVAFATCDTRQLLAETRESAGTKAKSAIDGILSANLDTAKAFERLRLDMLQRAQHLQARLKKAKERADVIRPLLIARGDLRKADERRRETANHMGRLRTIVENRLHQRRTKAHSLEALTESLRLARTIAQRRCHEINSSITHREVMASGRLHRLKSVSPESETAGLPPTQQAEAGSERASIDNKSGSSANTESPIATSGARSSKANQTPSTVQKQVRAFVRARAIDPAQRMQGSRRAVGKDMRSTTKGGQQAPAAKEVARRAAKQREQEVQEHLLQSARKRLEAGDIPILRTATGAYTFAPEAITMEERAVLMSTERRAETQAFLAQIADLQEKHRQQPPSSETPEQTTGGDDEADIAAYLYRKWKDGQGIS
ncbi:MAG: hypothetical protein ABGW87_07620 [Sphingomonadaceae bacterium]